MIQDIAPHRYDNTYRQETPKPEDPVFCVQRGRILLRETGVKNRLEIPAAGEFTGWADGLSEQAVYLFALDGRPYFLLETEKEETPDPALVWKKSQDIRAMEPMHLAFAAITALQLARWRESRRFCGRCGHRTEHSRTERALVCPACGLTEYPTISPASIVAVTDGNRLLMSRYVTARSAYRGYALIAGFVEIGETFEDTVRREAMEEVGVRVTNIRYFKSQPWAFTDTEMIGFFADLDGEDTIRLQEDELSEAGWYEREEIPDETHIISVGSELKMRFKYGPDWERILREKYGPAAG